LLGKSNLVICERHGDIVATDIAFALTADKFNKGITVTDAELEVFSKAEIEAMKSLAKERRDDIKALYAIAEKINL